MAQNDPWAQFRPQNQAPQQPQVEPQPFPGAQPITVQRNPSKVQAEEQAATRTAIDVHGDRRADAALGMEAQRLEIARQKAEADAKARAANGGVETTASQDMASGHAIMLGTNLSVLQQLGQKNPRALAPTWAEKVATGLSGDDPDVKAWSQSPDRQVADNAYRNILESAIYLSTGAAAPPDQVKRIAGTLMPSMFDQPATLAYKRKLLEAYIAQARERAGPADVKAQEALQGLTGNLGALYGNGGTPWDQESAQKMELSGERKSVPIPPEMQQEYQQWMGQHPPGTLKLDDYLNMYQGLTQKYEFALPASSIASAKDYVDNYNKGHAGLTIPRPDRELSAAEKLVAQGANSDIGVGVKNFANAMTLGIPEMMAGREARRASHMADEAHPKSALAGEILGSIAPTSGLEGLALRGAGKVIEGQVARKVASEVAGNSAYGAVRGYTGAEPEDRGTSAALGGLVGGLAPLAARGAVKGARGFMGDGTREAVDNLGASTFTMPGERAPLPADDITPPRYQGMSDDELRAEVQQARQGVDAWGSQSRIVGENAAARKALETEAQRVAASNANRQEVFVKQNFRSTMQPDQVDALRAQAAKQFPTDPAEVMQQPDFAARMGKIVDPGTGNLEPLDALHARIARLEDHLSVPSEPATGTIPAVDLTTPQRVGIGSTEEALQGVPFIAGAREKAVESWNKQNSARVLARIGEELPKDIPAGQEANAYVNGQLNKAYNALRPSIVGRVDQPFDTAIAALRKQAVGNGSPERQALWAEVEDALQKFRKPDGTFDGTGYRELSTQLRRLTDVWTSNNNPAMTTAAQDMARMAESVRKQTQALVNRANPAAGRRLKQLEGAWAHQIRIEAASRGGAKATRGVYAPDEYLNAIERLDTSRNKAAVSRGQGLDQPYAQDAREVLGGKPAKKASIKETAVGAASLHFGGVPAAAVLTGLTMGYIPGVKRLVQAIVEGKLGATPEAVTQALQGSKVGDTFLKGIDADARQKLLQQLIRAEAQKPAAQ